ncbi:MAG: TrmB family transcriptional regulator [Candidatus Nanoarchaeia archaeon]
MVDLNVIRELGLTENEAKVYLCLLEEGQLLAGQISRKTGIHRRNVYDITERLIKKGLIGYINKNNRKLFEASSPNRLKEILDQKQLMLEDNMANMLLMYNKTSETQETNFYKGTEGLKNIFQDQLTENNKEILILGASSQASNILPFYFKWYDLERKNKNIRARIISSDQLGKITNSQIRFLPQKYANPLAVNIYKDKVALILWQKEPLAILIKNKDIANSYRQYFELMWKIAKE